MPKAPVKTIKVIKDAFMRVINSKGYSIRTLTKKMRSKETAEHIRVNAPADKTLRRALNEGQMRKKHIYAIAEYIDVDPRLLIGQLVSKGYKTDNEDLKQYFLEPLNHVNRYPFSRMEREQEFERLRTERMGEAIKHVLAWFNIAFAQYERLDSEQKYKLLHDLLDVNSSIMYKYFDKDAYGNKGGFEGAMYILDGNKEYQDELDYADTVTREQFVESPPEGYTKEQIKNMSAKEIYDLVQDEYYEMYLNDHPEDTKDDSFSHRYDDVPIVEWPKDDPDEFKEK